MLLRESEKTLRVLRRSFQLGSGYTFAWLGGEKEHTVGELLRAWRPGRVPNFASGSTPTAGRAVPAATQAVPAVPLVDQDGGPVTVGGITGLLVK